MVRGFGQVSSADSSVGFCGFGLWVHPQWQCHVDDTHHVDASWSRSANLLVRTCTSWFVLRDSMTGIFFSRGKHVLEQRNVFFPSSTCARANTTICNHLVYARITSCLFFFFHAPNTHFLFLLLFRYCNLCRHVMFCPFLFPTLHETLHVCVPCFSATTTMLQSSPFPLLTCPTYGADNANTQLTFWTAFPPLFLLRPADIPHGHGALLSSSWACPFPLYFPCIPKTYRYGPLASFTCWL